MTESRAGEETKDGAAVVRGNKARGTVDGNLRRSDALLFISLQEENKDRTKRSTRTKYS